MQILNFTKRRLAFRFTSAGLDTFLVILLFSTRFLGTWEKTKTVSRHKQFYLRIDAASTWYHNSLPRWGDSIRVRCALTRPSSLV